VAVTIQEARTSAQRRAFLELPFSLHAGDPIWSPPLLDDLARYLQVLPGADDAEAVRGMLVELSGVRSRLN
jgi:hypothetical protein